MAWFSFKVFLSALVIAGTSWLAGKRPGLAGFLLALPIASLMALAFAQVEHRDAARTVAFAKGIFAGVPLSLLFFVPFLLADRLSLGIWGLYALGLALLAVGYLVHRHFVG